MNGFIFINQKGLTDYCTNNGYRIDLIDATILSYITNFLQSDKIIKKLINNKVYGWISSKKIIEDNPLLNITNTEVIGRRVKKLVDIGLLHTYICKEEGNKKYYAITENLHKIITNTYLPTDSKVDTLPIQKSIPTDSKVDTLPIQKSIPTDSKVDTLPTDESGNSNIINNNIIENNNNLKKEKNIKKRKKDEFSFEKKMEYSQVSEEYKAKLKSRVLLEFGVEALDLFEKFELQLEAKGYKYKNFYKAFIAWNKDKLTKKDIGNYIIEEKLGQDWLRIGIRNNKVYAVNMKTLELKVGEVVLKQSETSIDEVEQAPINANMSDLLNKAIKKF